MLALLFLFMGAFFAALLSGAAGFGGALLLLPLLVATVGVTQAVPLLSIAQCIGNLSRAGFGFAQIHWRSVAWFLLGALPCSGLGALLFVQLPQAWVTRAVGLAILLFAALQRYGLLNRDRGRVVWLVGGGSLVGLLSGVVGSAGPLAAAIFLSRGLPPVAYIASEAVTALAIHAVKIVVYQHYLALNRECWSLAGLLGIAMILGTWLARRLIERLPRHVFQRWVTGLLLILASYMVIHG